MPDFPIIDTHVHLYDPDLVSYAWMTGKPVVDWAHRLMEFDTARGAEVEGIVWVEVGADPGQHLEEARWVAELAARDPRIMGMVAHAPLERGAAAGQDIERLLEHRRSRGSAACCRTSRTRRSASGPASSKGCSCSPATI